jgi:hypothetical protein
MNKNATLQRNNNATLQLNNHATLQRNNHATLQRNNHATLDGQNCSRHLQNYDGQNCAKVAVILDFSRAFQGEHRKFKPLTTVYVLPVHTL